MKKNPAHLGKWVAPQYNPGGMTPKFTEFTLTCGMTPKFTQCTLTCGMTPKFTLCKLTSSMITKFTQCTPWMHTDLWHDHKNLPSHYCENVLFCCRTLVLLHWYHWYLRAVPATDQRSTSRDKNQLNWSSQSRILQVTVISRRLAGNLEFLE